MYGKSVLAGWRLLDPQFLRQPHFRFVDNFFEAGETRKGKAVDRDGADFADGQYRSVIQGREMRLLGWPQTE